MEQGFERDHCVFQLQMAVYHDMFYRNIYNTEIPA